MIDELMDGYDVVVIGGGPAGLNGALMLARSRRSVAVIDAGAPRNRPAEGVHGLLGHDGIAPPELIERGRGEVRRYGGQVVTGEIIRAVRDGDGFIVALADGRSVGARRLLVTTGLVDQLPDLPGVRERWGRDVLHCAYCHGWEVRDGAIGVLASGPMSAHQALLFRQLSEDVMYFSHTMPPNEEQAEQLASRGIRVVDGEVASLEVLEDRLTGVRLHDGTVVGREALVVSPRMVARAGFLSDLGLRPTEHPSGLGEHIRVDPTGRTDVAGVWAAGNVADLGAQVGASAAGGAFAAAQVNADLVAEETRRAVERSRNVSSVAT
ncbi:MAG TPA: NAD(P)/FAD-dependent oxidoreductase [Actinomycetota bacterium]|nr:NAD(P)/FAD-dependent oxidoreductase [Actinomycetota bacterium]